MAGMSENPFKIGDRVQFDPNERAQGWSWFGPGTIQPNDIGVVSRIEDKTQIFIRRDLSTPDDKEVGGFYWSCFKRVG
jgi:hypothetical protein